MTTTKKWLVDELKSMFGFDEVDEMASYLLNFPPNDVEGLTNYLEELLGKNPATQRLSADLSSRLIAESDDSIRVGMKKKKKSNHSGQTKNISKNTSHQFTAPATNISEQSSSITKFPDKKLSQKEKARLNKLSKPQMGGIKISYEGKNNKTTQDDGFENVEDFPAELQLTHAATPTGNGLIVNCLHCGYINVVSPKAEKIKIFGACSYCDEILNRGSEVTTANGFIGALALKDRLIEFDTKCAERHSIVDDESDYYTSSAWLSELEQEELKKRDNARHEKMHSRNGNLMVSIDIAGRRVVQEVDEGSIEAARNRFVQTNDSAVERHLDNLNALKEEKKKPSSSSSSSSSSCSSSSSLSAAATPFSINNGQSERKLGGLFQNETLTGRSLDIVCSLASLFQKQQAGESTSSKNTSNRHGGKSSEAIEDLQSHLAPWRSSATSRPQRVQFD